MVGEQSAERLHRLRIAPGDPRLQAGAMLAQIMDDPRRRGGGQRADRLVGIVQHLRD